MMKRLSFWTFFFIIAIGCNKACVRKTFSEDFDLKHRYKSQNTMNKSKRSVVAPEWLILRPSNDLYYIGIGQANIDDNNNSLIIFHLFHYTMNKSHHYLYPNRDKHHNILQ